MAPPPVEALLFAKRTTSYCDRSPSFPPKKKVGVAVEGEGWWQMIEFRVNGGSGSKMAARRERGLQRRQGWMSGWGRRRRGGQFRSLNKS